MVSEHDFKWQVYIDDEWLNGHKYGERVFRHLRDQGIIR